MSNERRKDSQAEYMVEPRALPAASPLTGRDPLEIAEAIVNLDEQALAQALSKKNPPVNDPLPATFDKTPLHLAVRMYSIRMTSHSNADREAGQVLDRMIGMLLKAGANPVARDANHLHPSAYAEAIPVCLRDRMLQEAAQDHVDWEPETARRMGNSNRSASRRSFVPAYGHNPRFLQQVAHRGGSL